MTAAAGIPTVTAMRSHLTPDRDDPHTTALACHGHQAIQEPYGAKYGASAADVVTALGGLGYTMHAWDDGGGIGWRPATTVTARRRNLLTAAPLATAPLSLRPR